MELRHLRYFVAVAEEGSLTVAATRRLHTAQPSLSRQIRDLEHEVGVALMTRNARGIELTAAGRAFLDHARLALAQVEAAREAARRAARPAKPSFALGFLTGQELEWLRDSNLKLMKIEHLTVGERRALKAHYTSVDARVQWLVMIEAFKSRNVRRFLEPLFRSPVVSLFLVRCLFDEALRRLRRVVMPSQQE